MQNRGQSGDGDTPPPPSMIDLLIDLYDQIHAHYRVQQEKLEAVRRQLEILQAQVERLKELRGQCQSQRDGDGQEEAP